MKVLVQCGECPRTHVYDRADRRGVKLGLCEPCAAAKGRNYRINSGSVVYEYTCAQCGVKEVQRRPDHRGAPRTYCPPCAYERARSQNRSYRTRDRLKKYGITKEQYETALAEQGNVCAICGGDWGARQPCVDHCHETGKFRGLLCGACNTGIGQFREDQRSMISAIRYLRRHS